MSSQNEPFVSHFTSVLSLKRRSLRLIDFSVFSLHNLYCYKLYKNCSLLLDPVCENDILGHSALVDGSQQRVEAGANDAHSLVDVDVFISDAGGRCPCETVEEIRQHEFVHRQGKVNPRAPSSPRREWQEVEILAIDIHF